MPPLIVTDSSYEFVPPHQGRIWPRLLSRFSTRMIRTRYGVHSVEIRDQQKLATLLADGHGIVLAPNHCRMADAMVLQSLSQSLHQPFFIMASSHLFRGNRLIKWALRRIGAFSVYREGADRKAVETAVDIIVQNKRPLVLFPEGVLSHANDRLNALMEGVSFIARTAARKRQKADGDSKSVCIVPVAIRYLFQGDLVTAAGPILADIERRLSWRTQDNMPIVERVYKVGNALLGLKETEYLGGPRPGHIADRLQALIDALLLPLEHEWLKSRNDDSVINRVKKLRQAVVPGMICEDEPATERTPLPSEELDRRWRQLQDMQFAQALSLYPREYIASRPTVDRILETVERMAENLSGKEQVSPPLKAIIQVGDPIPVAAKRERGTDGDPVLNQLEASLTDMLNSLSRESTLCSDHQAAS
ncbi:MAG: 1-acyl-sn-glycerol-3-phosphate acyltransferase [Fuerstiella sp.]|nr:1-acyl-sn-glycerol-3-phosphate acyltransferase [Fuerstiella sp.]